jgi:hypothetical protein
MMIFVSAQRRTGKTCVLIAVRRGFAAVVRVSSLRVAGLPLVRAAPTLIRRQPGTGVAGAKASLHEVRRCVMDALLNLLLILLLIYFGAVLLWAGPRLYRMVRAQSCA